MPETKTITIYRYSELSDEAKQRAREWYLSGFDFDAEPTLDDLGTICDLLGITLDTRPVRLHGGGTRQKPEIHWAGFGSQGDGLSFTGLFTYRKGCAKLIRQHAPQDTELHAIADRLTAICRPWFYRVSARLERQSSRYSHEHAVSLAYAVAESQHGTEIDLPNGDAYALLDTLRDLMRWGYSHLQADYDWQTSEEQIADMMEANDYTFDEDGRPA